MSRQDIQAAGMTIAILIAVLVVIIGVGFVATPPRSTPAAPSGSGPVLASPSGS